MVFCVTIPVNEMLQTAKLFARRGNGGFDARGTVLSSRSMNGLTFGEFCVLAADLKRFRTQSSQLPSRKDGAFAINGTSNEPPSKNKDELKPADCCSAPEVFLGGSCNPTTWRADVAIPTLKNLGISFYNPVSVQSVKWRFESESSVMLIELSCSKSRIGHQIWLSWSIERKRKHGCSFSSSIRKLAHQPAPSKQPTLLDKIQGIWCWCCIRIGQTRAFSMNPFRHSMF